MNKLEQQAREILVEKQAEEMYVSMKMPEYQTAMQDIVENFLDTIIEESFWGISSEGEAGAFKDMMMGQYLALMGSEAYLQQQAREEAENSHMTTGEARAKLITHYMEMPGSKTHLGWDEFNRRTTEFLEEMTPYIEKSQAVVRALAGIIENEGYEHAQTDAAVFQAYRTIFPSREEYILAVRDNEERAASVFSYVNEVASSCVDDNYVADIVTDKLTSVFSTLLEKTKDVRLQLAEEKADQIYGVSND